MLVIVYMSIITTILVIFYKTKAVVEYMPFLPIVKSYKQHLEQSPGLEFVDYLTFGTNNCFATRLLSCSYCTAFWLALCAGLFLVPIAYVPIIYVGSIILYRAA